MIWRLLHISDLHFCSTPKRANLWKLVKLRISEANADASRITTDIAPTIWLPDSHCPEIAEFLARKIYRIRNEIDLLLISGDIATTGLAEDLRIALRYVNNLPANGYFGADGNATIRSNVFPMLLMPGNHDRYRSAAGESGSRTFDLIFDGYWGLRDPDIHTAILNSTDRMPLGIIAADFALRSDADASFPSRWMRYGQGFAYQDIVEKLVKKTDELRNRFFGIGVIWVIHFPPSNDGGLFGYREFRYYDRVVDAANARNIKTILAGHLHERKSIRVDDLDIICAGSGCVFGEERGNWLHHLEIDVVDGIAKLSKKIDYWWNDLAGDFTSS